MFVKKRMTKINKVLRFYLTLTLKKHYLIKKNSTIFYYFSEKKALCENLNVLV